MHATRGSEILIAGNESPWFPPLPDLSQAPPPRSAGGPFRLLLSHSPDQIRWAQHNQFDLMLAGHTHGGQFRLPWLGPFVAPSKYGVRYASGEFYEPPTLMQVSRGLSGLQPLRLNCPPELTKVVLRATS
jgi:predicted MPP superfamily phosphohydrolase